MAKCVRLYYNNIHMNLELAKSDEGYWFYREYKFNHFIKKYTYTKWIGLGKLNDIQHTRHTYENMNGNELTKQILHFIFNDEDIIVEYNSYHDSKMANYLRLPNMGE